MTKPIGLELSPLDVLFFRDGRPFGASTRAMGGLPTPQILAGSLRTALLQKYRVGFNRWRNVSDFAEALKSVAPDRAWIADIAFRGPWFTRQTKGKQLDVLVPVPNTLHKLKKDKDTKLRLLRPLSEADPPGWDRSRNNGLRPLWRKSTEATEPAEGFLGADGLRLFLHDKPPGELIKGADLFEYDNRTGIEVEADRLTAAESQIYAIRFLAPKENVGLYAEARLPNGAPEDAFDGISVVALGGEGRRAALETRPAFDWRVLEPPSTTKTVILLTTPCLSSEGWRPAPLKNLVAAAVPSPIAVSGWDLAKNGPKPTRFAAPAGSVYFLEGPADDLPSVLADAPDDQLGWGCYLKGVWSDE